MEYSADFVTEEEHKECLIEKKPFKPQAQINYLRVEPINENGIVFKAKLRFRHPSLYSLELGNWTYLDKNDLRSIVPIMEFREKGTPFYITFGTGFFEVREIRVDAEDILVFILEQAQTYKWSLN